MKRRCLRNYRRATFLSFAALPGASLSWRCRTALLFRDHARQSADSGLLPAAGRCRQIPDPGRNALKPPVRGAKWRSSGVYTLVERAVLTAL